MTLADSGDAPPAIMPSRVDCPWCMAPASSVWFSRVALAQRVWTSDVANAPASVLRKLDMPAAFAVSSGLTVAMASPVIGTKNRLCCKDWRQSEVGKSDEHTYELQ